MIPKYNIQRIRKKIMANYADYLPPILSFNFISQEKFLRRLDKLKTGIINRLESSDGVLDLQVAKDLDRFFHNGAIWERTFGKSKQVSDLPDLLLLEGEDDVTLPNPVLTNVVDSYAYSESFGSCEFGFECMPSFEYEFFIPVYQPIRIETEQRPTEEGFVFFDGGYYDREGDEVSFAKFDDDGEQQYLLEENGDLVFETSQTRVSIPIPVVKHDLTPEGDVIAYTLPPGTDFEDKVEYASELFINIQGKVIVQTRALENLMDDEVRQLTEIIENIQPERLHAMAKSMGFVT